MGMRAAMELALALVDDNTHLHAALTWIFSTPRIAPGAPRCAVAPATAEAQLCMEMIADTGKLASLDVVELNPALDIRNRTASRCRPD